MGWGGKKVKGGREGEKRIYLPGGEVYPSAAREKIDSGNTGERGDRMGVKTWKVKCAGGRGKKSC